jgi:glycosyltransferase involved in cell wall biosynthesis
VNILFVTHCVPQRDISGGAMTCWALLKQLLGAKHQVRLVFLQESENSEISNAMQLRKLGNEFQSLKYVLFEVPERNKIYVGWRQLLGPMIMSKEYLLPSFLLNNQLEMACQDFNPDIIFNYHYTAAASTSNLRHIPQITITGDLLCQPIISRWKLLPKEVSLDYVFRTFRTAQAIVMYRKLMVKLLNLSAVAGSFGYHDAYWLKMHGVRKSEHFYSPINDDGVKNKIVGSSKKIKIIAGMSNLASTSTHAALVLIVEEILPILEQEIGSAFEIHIIGQGHPPKQLFDLMPRETVKLRGFVSSVEDEFNSADILLQPTPVFIGFRIRIIKAFCHSLCVVTHTNDTVNMPEIIAGENALVGSSGKEIANLTLRAIRDPDLRDRIARKGRETYEKYYLPEKAAQKILKRIETIA